MLSLASRKLDVLISRSDWTTAARDQCVINLSSRQLDSRVVNSLGFGISLAFGNGNINPMEVTKGFCGLDKYNNFDVSSMYACKGFCLLYTSPSPRDKRQSRMPSSA